MSEMDPETPHVDVAGYVLGTLDAADRESFERHLAACASCRRELEELGSLASVLGEAPPAGGPDVRVPAGLEARVLGAIAREPARRGERVQRVPTPARRAGWRPAWVAAAAAVVIAFAGGLGLGRLLPQGGQPAPPPAARTVHLVAAAGATGSGTATVRERTGGTSITLTVRDLPPPTAGHVYTCWLVAPDDTVQHQDRVSVGSFTTSGQRPLTLRWDTAADLARFPNMGVTLEPENGNPVHQGPKVLAATKPL